MPERIVRGLRLLAGAAPFGIQQDPLKILDDGNLITQNPVMRSAGASAYQLLMAIGIIGVVCSLILAGIKLGFTKNSRSRNEVKKSIGTTLLIAVVLFGFVAILGMILEIVNSL